MNYYRLIDDLNIPNRWFLGNLKLENEFDFWKYITVNNYPIEIKSDLEINIREKGITLDFTMADFELLIVNSKVAKLLSNSEVQLIPVNISGVKSSEIFSLLIINTEIDCVDESKSIFEKWEEGNEIRPDKAGQFKVFHKLILNPSSIDAKNIFRIKNYNGIIVVSENMKRSFENNGVTGVKFIKITE